MEQLVYKNRIREYAKKLGMRVSEKSFPAIDERLMLILKEAAVRAKADRRKTILPRDLHHEPDLFDVK